MKSRRGRDSGREATSLLATAYVVVVGTLLCMFCVMAFRGNQRILIIIAAIAAFLLMLAFLFLRGSDGQGQGGIWLFWKMQKPEEDPLKDYVTRRRRNRDRKAKGSNQPPTLEEIQLERTFANNWVPRNEHDTDKTK